MREEYQNKEDTNVVGDTLKGMVREGARRMWEAALKEEESAFLGRDRYEQGEEFRGYRNDYHPNQELVRGAEEPAGSRAGCAAACGGRRTVRVA